MHNGLRHVEHEAELERRSELCIERSRVVVDRDFAKALLQLANLVSRFHQRLALAIDAAAGLHSMRHLVADIRDALGTAGLMQELLLEPSFLVGSLRENRALRGVGGALDILNCRTRRARSINEEFAERIRAEPVGAIDTHASSFASRIQTLQRGLTVDIGVHAAHHVVLDGPYANRFTDGIE